MIGRATRQLGLTLGLSLLWGAGCSSDAASESEAERVEPQETPAESLAELGIDDGASMGAVTVSAVSPDKSANLALKTGAEVSVSKGAARRDIEISLERPDDKRALPLVKAVDKAHKVASAPYVVTPHGETFKKSVDVTLPLAAGRDKEKLAVVRLTDEKDRSWEIVAVPKVSEEKASFQVSSFSVYMLVELEVAMSEFVVTASAGSGGAIDPASVRVPSGQTTSFVVTPNEGFKIARVTGCGGSLLEDTYTTAAVTAACDVQASFVTSDTPMCAQGTYSAAKDGTNCKPWTACLAGTHEVEAPTPLSDRVCVACSAGQYCAGDAAPVSCAAQAGFDADASPATTCTPWQVCSAGQKEDAAPSETRDRTCVTCVAGEYCQGGDAAAESCASNGGFDADGNPATACVLWATCVPGEYEFTAPNATTDRMCTECAQATFSATANASRCSPWTPCPTGHYETQPPTATSDRVCEACTQNRACEISLQ